MRTADVVSEVARRLGGVRRLLEWTQEDPRNEHASRNTILGNLPPASGSRAEAMVKMLARKGERWP